MDYLIAIAGAFVAGGINTLSGNGSAITLTILMELLGLPANVANGTNRVGVLTQGLAGTLAFRRAGRFAGVAEDRADMRRIILITTLGAALGIYLGLSVDNASFRAIFRYLLIVMLVVIVVRPKRWLTAGRSVRRLPLVATVPLYFALGVYGGFIQMGMGIFFLATLVLLARYEIIQANVVKVAVVTLYTALAVAVFAWRGLVDWRFGLLMAVGQTAGGYLTAVYATRDPRAGTVTYYLLIVVVLGAIVKAFFL